MSALDKLLETDLVINAVYDALTVREKRTARTGFLDICCPMCVTRGETQDRKFRCGIISGDGIGVNCFNCGFKSRWRIGERLSNSMRNFLNGIGVPGREIKRLAYWADTIKSMVSIRPDVQTKLRVMGTPEFDTINLPHGTRALEHWAEMGCTDPNFLATAEYMFSRGDALAEATTYFWTPKTFNRRLIIPCYHQKNLVGWVGRAISDEIEPRYHKEIPSNYLFNSHFLTIPDRKYVFIVEGIFDALAVDGVAALGASLNDIQIHWIMQSGKQPVVVADRDKMGKHLIEVALKHNWPVATVRYLGNQWWHDDIKDCADAVKRYGKLYTVQSIVSNLTWNVKQIEQRILYQVTDS